MCFVQICRAGRWLFLLSKTWWRNRPGVQRLAKRNIHVKRFSSIPMADAEMIFPDKRVYVKPLTLITLLVTVILGLAACVTTFMTVRCSSCLRAAISCLLDGHTANGAVATHNASCAAACQKVCEGLMVVRQLLRRADAAWDE